MIDSHSHCYFRVLYTKRINYFVKREFTHCRMKFTAAVIEYISKVTLISEEICLFHLPNDHRTIIGLALALRIKDYEVLQYNFN